MTIILRRKGLGNGSCNGFARHLPNLQVIRNDRLGDGAVDSLIRWGCTSQVNQVRGGITFNNVASIHFVNNKRSFRLDPRISGLCPRTWGSVTDLINDGTFQHYVEGNFIVRPSYHAQGRFFYVINTPEVLVQICNRMGEGNYYISPVINKVAEYRVFVCQGAVAWVARKTPGNPDQIAWNVARGGRFDNVNWNEWDTRVLQYAISAMYPTGLDFGGVDVMVDDSGRPYVLEINSAPSHTSDYRIETTAKVFADMIEKNSHGKYEIGGGTRNGNFTYRDYIHPAVSGNSRMTYEGNE